jgi:hypothetical protein
MAARHRLDTSLGNCDGHLVRANHRSLKRSHGIRSGPTGGRLLLHVCDPQRRLVIWPRTRRQEADCGAVPDNTYLAAQPPSRRHVNDDHEEYDRHCEAQENDRQYQVTANYPENPDNKEKGDNRGHTEQLERIRVLLSACHAAPIVRAAHHLFGRVRLLTTPPNGFAAITAITKLTAPVGQHRARRDGYWLASLRFVG